MVKASECGRYHRITPVNTKHNDTELHKMHICDDCVKKEPCYNKI